MTDANGIVTRPWADFFNALYRYEQLFDDVETDGTYTLGNGTTDGEVTIEMGLITSIQEVVA